MKQQLELTTSATGADVVVVARGGIDMASSPRLLAEIQQALGRGQRILVDLADVSYIDSSGIAVLVQGLKAARKRRQEFLLRHPSRQVVAVLELADLRRLFNIDPDPAGSP